MRNISFRIAYCLLIFSVIFGLCLNLLFAQATPTATLTLTITATPTPPYNPPFILITDDATDITSNSATLNGTIVSDDPYYLVYCVGFEYGTASRLYTNSMCEGDGLMVSGTRSVRISGLSPVTTYYYRMYTVEKLGSAYGNEESFTTLAATPTGTPTPVCEAESMEVSPQTLKLRREASGVVTVTVAGNEGCPVVGETVTAKIKSGQKRISISPQIADTNVNGQAIVTIYSYEEDR